MKNPFENSSADELIRWQACDKNHQPISFMARERGDCPVCDWKRRGELLEDESQRCSNSIAFYRSLIQKIGDMFGEAARTSDDGSVQDEVGWALKVPDLVRNALDRLEQVLDAPYFNLTRTRKRVVRRSSQMNPRILRRKTTNTAIILGACIGFVAGMIGRGSAK